jgi:hypothetical protein
MSSELSVESIFSQEEILMNEEQMLKQKIDQIYAKNHEYRYKKVERKYLLKLINERDYSLEDIKEHLERVMQNAEDQSAERNLLNNQIQIKYTRLVAERKLRKDKIRLEKENEKKEDELHNII